MDLPVMPPVEPMLAKLEPQIPRGEGWRYEPKWDGFRAIVFRDGHDTHVGSRGRRPLHRYFPEVVAAARETFPRRCVVDGEIVIAVGRVLDFENLQLRLHPAESRVRMLSGKIPASFVAFDLLAQGSKDLREEPLAKRWSRLAKMLDEDTTARTMRRILSAKTDVVLTPQTEDSAEAERWFDDLEPAGLDGLIAKRNDLPYQPGKRVMVKVKHQRTIDCVVGGYRIHKSGTGVGSLLLGLYDHRGVLHHVGAAGAFPVPERAAMLARLRPLEGGQSFGEDVMLGGPSRWRAEEREWIPVEPRLVCEVAYDHFQGGRRFRHLVQLLRWREDVDPKECTFDQAKPGRG